MKLSTTLIAKHSRKCVTLHVTNDGRRMSLMRWRKPIVDLMEYASDFVGSRYALYQLQTEPILFFIKLCQISIICELQSLKKNATTFSFFLAI